MYNIFLFKYQCIHCVLKIWGYKKGDDFVDELVEKKIKLKKISCKKNQLKNVWNNRYTKWVLF